MLFAYAKRNMLVYSIKCRHPSKAESVCSISTSDAYAHVCMVVADIANKDLFNYASNWLI